MRVLSRKLAGDDTQSLTRFEGFTDSASSFDGLRTCGRALIEPPEIGRKQY